jgi:hypothetical protein
VKGESRLRTCKIRRREAGVQQRAKRQRIDGRGLSCRAVDEPKALVGAKRLAQDRRGAIADACERSEETGMQTLRSVGSRLAPSLAVVLLLVSRTVSAAAQGYDPPVISAQDRVESLDLALSDSPRDRAIPIPV